MGMQDNMITRAEQSEKRKNGWIAIIVGIFTIWFFGLGLIAIGFGIYWLVKANNTPVYEDQPQNRVQHGYGSCAQPVGYAQPQPQYYAPPQQVAAPAQPVCQQQQQAAPQTTTQTITISMGKQPQQGAVQQPQQQQCPVPPQQQYAAPPPPGGMQQQQQQGYCPPPPALSQATYGMAPPAAPYGSAPPPSYV